MTLNELIEQLTRIRDNEGAGEWDVVNDDDHTLYGAETNTDNGDVVIIQWN